MKRSAAAPLRLFNVKDAVPRIALLVASLSLLPLAAVAAAKGRPRSAVAKNDRADRSEKADKPERSDKPDKTEKPDKADKGAKASAGQAGHATKPRVYD